MASKIPIDILSIIFEELEKEHSTLYPCIFVNREWCQVGIPLLWKNPWKIFNEIDWMNTNKYKDVEIRYKILFKGFLMLMTKDQRNFLNLNGIEFPVENLEMSLEKNSKKVVNSNVLAKEFTIGTYFKSVDFSEDSTSSSSPSKNPSSSQKPLFNYASFCKIIDSNKINLMVYHNIRERYPRYSLNRYHEYLVEQEIYKLLIINTSKIRCMLLSDMPHPITFYPNSSSSLSQLNELHCNTSIESTVFYGLSQLCRNIEKLVIEGYNDENDGLITFIKQQINLRNVKVYEDDEPYAQGKCRRIGYALTTKSSSIRELDIGNTTITFPPLLLESFQNNLTVFKFGINYETTEEVLVDELESVLKSISIPNLQQLFVYNSCPSFNIIAKIVEKSKGDLRKISIGAYSNAKDVDILINSISKNCPKLEHLMIWVGESIIELMELFRKCKHLRGLVLQFLWTTIFKRHPDDLLEVICDNASKRLKKFKISADWEISKKALEGFLNNWRKQKRNSLDFYISMPKNKNNYDDIINKYKEMGVIRNYMYEEITNFHACIDDNVLDYW